MGRSKFPGKPSKSINRKRISVLQIQPNEDQETTLTVAGGGTSSSSTSSASHHKNKNGKREDGDDGSGGGGGVGGSAGTAGGSATNGSRSSGSSSSSEHNRNRKSDNNHAKDSTQNVNGSSGSAAAGGGGGGGNGNTSAGSNKTSESIVNPSDFSNIPLADMEDTESGEEDEEDDEDDEDEDDEDEDDEDEDGEDENDEGEKRAKATVSSSYKKSLPLTAAFVVTPQEQQQSATTTSSFFSSTSAAAVNAAAGNVVNHNNKTKDDHQTDVRVDEDDDGNDAHRHNAQQTDEKNVIGDNENDADNNNHDSDGNDEAPYSDNNKLNNHSESKTPKKNSIVDSVVNVDSLVPNEDTKNNNSSDTATATTTTTTTTATTTTVMDNNTTNGSLIASPSSSCSSSLSLSSSSSSSLTLTTSPSISSSASITSVASTSSLSSSSSSSLASLDKKQKKTVTFKNVLETSDDKSAVKKCYNPDNRKPLVSIIKKDLRSSDCIVRPSRLTEILKNNNSNIDKYNNTLKFRTHANVTSDKIVDDGEPLTSSILTGPILRLFGAPSIDEEEEDAYKQNLINFRITKDYSDDDDDEEEDDDDDDDDDDDGDGDDVDEEQKDDVELDRSGKGEVEQRKEHQENTKEKRKLENDEEAQKDRKSVGKCNEADEDEDDGPQLIVDKHFVLPKRSTRSSRVIKPNKRLIEDGIICKKSSLKSFSNNLNSKETKANTNYFGLRDYKSKEGSSGGNCILKSGKEQTSSAAFNTTNMFSHFSVGGLKANSFVLRQPRLQFDSICANTGERNHLTQSVNAAAALALSASLPKSLTQAISSAGTAASTAALLSPTFSSLNGSSSLLQNAQTNNSASVNPSMLCAVCSTSIHSKSLPQATKYGELSCEYCRKFISKIAKKSLAMKNSPAMKITPVQCKADGNCLIVPPLKAGHVKNFKKVYKERCGYCWLKKCLQTLQLPKVRLNAVLPLINSSFMKNSADTKLRRDLDVDVHPTKLLSAAISAIKWKPLLETSGCTADPLKINLKANPLTENVTFGSVPLLRPAILEKPLFLKTTIEPKVEKVEKQLTPPLKLMEGVKDAKQADSFIMEAALGSSSFLKTKRKDKFTDKDKERPHTPKEIKHRDLSILDQLKEEDKANIHLADEKPLASFVVNATTAAIPLSITTTTTTMCTNVVSPTNTVTTVSTTTTTISPSHINVISSLSPTTEKRQRIDLKGPRVKHVCRSASIVLGQPLALFGDETEGGAAATSESMSQEASTTTLNKKPIVTDENDNCASCKPKLSTTPNPETTNASTNPTECNSEPPLKVPKLESTNKSLMPVFKTTSRPNHYATHLAAFKKSSSTVNASNLSYGSHRRRDAVIKYKLLISIDFWENYDPAEVCQSGFGLIVTETVAQRALCFLCGSAGQEPLLFCACCCEPYHQYCVQDEFNLKHGSLDDTLLLNESAVSVLNGGNSNSSIARLNWLCPRCTVCYTCNMSSGAKVRCQKCQKNYHSTCLGTSKRLLGADRPLICVNCLKCRSCSTTKVTKFVGNLPMCTSCFKLRKRGNYCPVCQKCYDDQDFDLKMMECGDCHQWVHAKCEALTDEQYNLLSTLPESIEFICKRCARKSQEAKNRASEWRDAVKEEFKTSLMSVLKLLSKSRQACALLKLSPRKQLHCTCGAASNGKIQPKALQFNINSTVPEGDSQSSVDVYEFNDQHDREFDHKGQTETIYKKCVCQNVQQNGSQLSLVEIKQKIHAGSYVILAEFNYDMNLVIQQASCDELVIAYKEILSEQFPWFQNETQACTDALEEDMYETAGGAYGLNTSLDNESEYPMDVGMSETNNNNNEVERNAALIADLPADLDELMYNLKIRPDARICLLCRRVGEGMPEEEARLLYCGHDAWVHTNCALWSAEVFEEIDGSLQNVHAAVARGRMIKCGVCGNRGATVGCNVKSCGEHYHYPCARLRSCAFLADKTMYCPAHAASKTAASYETQFEVTRPVYVELERKRKKMIEPSKVQFHIGSLEVKQLGHILPRFSDSSEALIPVNFLCARLYWSSKEPWRLVEYTVRTLIHNSCTSSLIAGGALDPGRNFTVDHTQTNSALIQLGLAQIARWHTSLSKGEYIGGGDTEDNDYFGSSFAMAVDEEPQTNADLLPPEIKDAIFEDLPHELLDGISMLDIFNKCMNYEELGNEQSKDGVSTTTSSAQISADEDTMASISAFSKQLNVDMSNWCSSANHVEDALLSTTTVSATQAQARLNKLKKSSSPLVMSSDSVAAIKRRKISEGMLLSLNQQRSQKKDVVAAVSRRNEFTWSAEKRYNLNSDSKVKLMQVDGVDDTISEYRFISNESTTAATMKCERCQCHYRNYESFQRHLASCEPLNSSASESESEGSQTGATTAITVEQLQELNAKFGGQRATSLPFIQTIPTTQSIPQISSLQTSLGGLPLQLQGVSSLQNLQSLQQLQQLTQPQALSGNFFISAAQPNNTADELHLYTNTLQGLQGNLNGGFTFATPQTVTQNQPQLIAVSTNPDGTQQIIQLPAAPATPTPAPTYQTLQATNTDKKIVLPVGGGKPMKTMATKAAQQATAAAKSKLKAGTAVKPMQIQKPAQPVHSATQQLLNQQLLQQLQQAQQQTTATAPQLLFQAATAPNQPQIIMQQPATQNIISFVTTSTEGTQQPQLQYVTLPTPGTNTADFKPQAQGSTLFTTTNNAQPLLQTAYLQADASGNLVLTNTPQLLTTPQHPQVIGTLIQPQTLQLGGGNVITATTTSTAEGGMPAGQGGQAQQQQVIISGGTPSGTNGLEMLTGATTPQVILATTTQPMYYGLETIVQNTVMSSQQFVSTAMPGVLSQNASFSATTTQVFQASKIEPIVDIPAGYVLLNNVDANGAAAILQAQAQPQTQTANQTSNAQAGQTNFIQAALQQQAAAQAALAEQQQQQQQQQQVFRIQTPPVTTNNTTGPSSTAFPIQTPQLVVTQQPQQQTTPSQQFLEAANVQLVSAKIAPTLAQVKRVKTTPSVVTVSKVQPQVVNKVMPNSAVVTVPQQQPQQKVKQTHQQQLVLNKTVNATAQQPTPTTITGKSQPTATNAVKKTNMIRPLHKLEVKPKMMRAAATVVTKPTPTVTSNALPTPPANQQVNNNRMALLKPQQQQNPGTTPVLGQQSNLPQQQVILTTSQATPQQQQQITVSIAHQEQPQQYSGHGNNKNQNHQQLIDYVSLQQINQTNQQHYNVADALLLLDENSQPQIPQQLSHCSFSNNFEQQQQQQQQQQAPTEISTQVLPTIQRMPTYSNVNIVNPLQQYNNHNNNITTTTVNSTTTTTTTTTTVTTRPTNRVLPMQQRQYEQQNANNNLNGCSSIGTGHLTSGMPPAIAVIENGTAGNIKVAGNENKIAYEAEVKQILLHSPIPSSLEGNISNNSNRLQQPEQQQQPTVLHNQQSLQGNFIKSSLPSSVPPPPLAYDITDMVEKATNKVSEQQQQQQQQNRNTLDYVANNMVNECLITDPKFPPENEVMDADDLNQNHHAKSHNLDEEEEEDTFSLKMPSSVDTNDELSVDSDEPAVKAKISKILDNLTNEDCTDSLATASTLEAHLNACQHGFADLEASVENVTSPTQQQLAAQTAQTTPYYHNATEDASVFIAVQMANNIQAELKEATYELTEKLPNKLATSLAEPKLSTTHLAGDCSPTLPSDNGLTATPNVDLNTLSSLPATVVQPPPPQPPSKDPKKITGPHLLYEIQSEDGFTYKSTSITEIWEKVFEAVQVARRAHGLAPLPEGPLADMSGTQMIGLKTNALKYLIEQLPGVEKCTKYTPKYHRRTSENFNNSATTTTYSNSANLSSSTVNAALVGSLDIDSSSLDYTSDQEEMTENPYECARCEPYSTRSDYDMFSWLASRHRKQPVQVFLQPSDTELVPRRGTGSNLPMAMKYRTLKETYKDYVGVFRSHIHGRGLYCTKDIEAGEMVIEYAGELIRSTLTDQRERYYNSRGIGCYMFKIDENLVVDATMRGNAARFINHSCEPNCYSKVVDILGHKHIIIFALRRIVQGEELTYDYKFPFEEEKIPCTCGSKKCRKYLN
uniref:Histone-lysine N-methyltransferase trithorax n=1 Tax=Glossina morsitans morsitans TaxID=37546 RepID=A0A1B0FGB3_GLOMM